MGFDKIWIRINQFHLAMATPFRRPYVSWRVVSSIGELRGCTISGTRQHAGQAIAPIPRSSGDGPVEIQRRPISAFSRSDVNTKNNDKTLNHHHHHRARTRPPQFCWESRFGFRWSGEHRTITAEERKHGPNEPHGDPIF